DAGDVGGGAWKTQPTSHCPKTPLNAKRHHHPRSRFFPYPLRHAIPEAGLKAMGRQVLSVQLPTFFSSLDQCCDALAAQVDPIAATAKTVHYVAHSMGGLIVRAYIARTQ